MKQLLSIVLRNQFNLFYRFGYTIIPKVGVVEFDGNFSEVTKEAINKQFLTITPFEYDEEYLILQFEKSIDDNCSFIHFEIQDLVSVFPLSQQAKTSIESKIDQRIRLEKPFFEACLPQIESHIERKEIEKAISALWTICKNEFPFDKYLADIGFENLFKGIEHRKNGIKASKIQNGNYWEYLIAYDRFEYFPNSTLGYFYDTGQVFAYSKGYLNFEGSGIHKFLEELNSSNPIIKLTEIIEKIKTEEQIKGFVSQTTVGDIKQYITTPLYLILRDEIRKSEDITQSNLFKTLPQLKKEFGDSFYYAVILLGAFFGFRKFYDLYYDALNLRFYKKFNEQKKSTVENEKKELLVTDIEVNELSGIEEKKKAEEQFIEVRNEETINDSITQHNTSDILSQYQKIVEEVLTKQKEIKLADIAILIKKQTGQKVSNTVVENVVKQMMKIEIIKIGNAKGVKHRENLLFNE